MPTTTLSPQFVAKVDQMAQRLGTQPDYLLQVMDFETGGTFDPAIRNKAGSGATGLIQFMPETARRLGTTTEKLARMTPEQQLDYVERYFAPYTGKLTSLQDTYMAVLYPKAIGKSAQQPLFAKGSQAYAQNAGLDTARKGVVTVGDAVRAVGRFAGRMLSPASAEAASPYATMEELERVLGQAPQAPPTAAPVYATMEELAQALGATPQAQHAPPEATPATPPPASEVDDQGLGPPGTAAAQGLTPDTPAPAPEQQPGILSRVRQGVQTLLAPIPPDQAGATAEAVSETIPGFEWLGFLPRAMQERIIQAMPETVRTAAATGVATATTAAGTALAGPVGGIAGSGAGYALNVGLGLEEPSTLGAGLSVVAPALPAAVTAGRKAIGAVARGSRAGQAIQQADEANAAAQAAYQAEQDAAEQAYRAGQADYQTTVRAREAERLQGVQERRTVAETRHAARETHREQANTTRQERAIADADALTQQQAREHAEQVQRYEQAVASQRHAVQTARQIPTRYNPDTSAQVLYRKVADIAPEAPVTLTKTQEVAAELQDVLIQVPSLQPPRMQRLLTDLRAARSTESVREVQRYLSDIGVLTRSNDSATRRTAKQLYSALHDDLAESAARLPETEQARDLLLQANATFRREMAVRDLASVIRRGLTVGDDGIPRIAPGRVLTQFDRLVETDTLFAGSFTPEDLARIRSDLAGLTGVERIPARPGAPPTPVQPRTVDPYTPRSFQEPDIPARERVVPQTTPADLARIPQRLEPGMPPEPVMPTLTPRDHGAFRSFLRAAGLGEAAFTWGLGPVSKVALAFEAKDKLADALAKVMLSPRWQSYTRHIMQPDGTVNLEALIALAGGRAALQGAGDRTRPE